MLVGRAAAVHARPRRCRKNKLREAESRGGSGEQRKIERGRKIQVLKNREGGDLEQISRELIGKSESSELN
jgi:hypothetical protein